MTSGESVREISGSFPIGMLFFFFGGKQREKPKINLTHFSLSQFMVEVQQLNAEAAMSFIYWYILRRLTASTAETLLLSTCNKGVV